MTNNRVPRRRGGFTMVELLVVIGLILFLMSISIVALNGAIGIARQRATQATLLKIHGLMQQRIDAFNRAMEKTNLQPAIDKLKKDMGIGSRPDDQNKVYEVLVKKQIFQSRFPQNLVEKNISSSAILPPPAPHQPITQSSALLYWILTSSEVYGIAPVDESEFSSSEVRDTDGDGLNEFVDAWGRPLRFYRWPTHLFRQGNASTGPGATGVNADYSPLLSPVDPKRIYASVLWSGLPAAPFGVGELDPLTRDPDDPTGQVARFVKQSPNAAQATAKLTYFQNTFSTPNTYHAFLIVSAGPDGRLGLEEPFSPTIPPASASTTPSLGTPQGRLGALDSTVGYVAIELHPINDNLTNRKR